MQVTEQIAMVGIVFGALGAILWWLRGRLSAVPLVGIKRNRRKLEALERLTLGPQQTLHLVRWGDATLLLACSPAGCRLLQAEPSMEARAVVRCSQ